LKEKFHRFQYNFYKEREMSDFRKLLLAFALIALLTGVASAQPPITCSVTAQPLTVRSEGLAEQTGDVLISCTGGAIPAAGSVLPQVNISVTLSTNITSRFLNDPITEALLFIDDPQPGTQSPCAPASGSTVCAPLTAGAGGSALFGATAVNVFQGVRQNDTTVVWLGVPINAPGTAATRLYRTKNVRAAIAGTSAPSGQIFAFVSIQNPPANLQLNNSTVNVAFVQQGLLFERRTRTGGGYSSTSQNQTFLFQCETFNRDLDRTAGAAGESYFGGGFQGGRSLTLRYREAYAASWKVRDINPALTEPGAQQNIPQNNNGAPPDLSTVVESGFYNTAFTATNGLNRAGRADHGTRLRAVFNNVPANVKIYVSAHALSSVAVASTTATRWTGGGETTALAAAYGVATTAAGSNVAAGTVLANPLSPAEQTLGGNTAAYPAGATAGLIEVPLSGGSGAFTWEVFGQDPNTIDTVSFAVATSYRSTNNPGLGTATVNASFAPISTSNRMSTTEPLPRFADTSTSSGIISYNICQTNLLFPFVSNQAGFDTGAAIANTTSDPYGTASQTGNCQLNYYGATTGGGAAPSRQTTTTPLSGGQTMVWTLSNGGTNGITQTPGFQGYIIAICNFRGAHGFAFISDVGANRLSHGYLALILDAAGLNRTGLTGESLGQ
jgi:hypothetical protein